MIMLTHSVLEEVYTVLGKRQVRAADLDGLLMSGIEYAIADELTEDYIHYFLNRYCDNTLIYKRDTLQCIAIFPRSVNLLYNN